MNGSNAICTRRRHRARHRSTNRCANGFTVNASSTYPISCIVYNRAPQPAGLGRADKRWVINGTTYVEGTQPTNFQATGSINGTPQDWGDPRGGFIRG